MKTLLRRRAAGGGENDLSAQYLTFIPLEDATFTFTQRGTGTMYYSIDGGAWNAAESGTETPTVMVGSEIRWKGTITPKTDASSEADNGIGTFSASGNYDAKGNPISIWKGDDFKGVTSLTVTRTFCALFKNDTHLVHAHELILCATSIVARVYYFFYYGCTSLVSGSDLPALAIANYAYAGMFRDCSSLLKPPVVAGTSGETRCCNAMFQGCSSLTESPVLNIATLPTYGYQNMFKDCSSLSKITILATDHSASSCIYQWVSGVAVEGTFIKDANTSYNSGVSGIPSGWTVVNV